MIEGETFELRIRAVDAEGTFRMGVYASLEVEYNTTGLKLGAYTTDPRWRLRDHFPHLHGAPVNITTRDNVPSDLTTCSNMANAPNWSANGVTFDSFIWLTFQV